MIRLVLILCFLGSILWAEPAKSFEPEFFRQDLLLAHYSIRIYKVVEGPDLLLTYYRSDGEYKDISKIKGHDSKEFEKRKYYVLGLNTGVPDSEVKGMNWSVAIDDEKNDVRDFSTLGVKCSLVTLTFYLNKIISIQKSLRVPNHTHTPHVPR